MAPPTFQLVLIVTLVFMAAQMILGLWHMRRAKFYANMARAERIRMNLGLARARLVRLVERRLLDPNTLTFREVYFVQSLLMRGAKSYPALDEATWNKVLRFERLEQEPLLRESNDWCPEIRAIVVETANAIRNVWTWHVPFNRPMRVVKHALYGSGLVSYDSLEHFCERAFFVILTLMETVAMTLRVITFKMIDSHLVSTLKAVKDMREAERILRKASQNIEPVL